MITPTTKTTNKTKNQSDGSLISQISKNSPRKEYPIDEQTIMPPPERIAAGEDSNQNFNRCPQPHLDSRHEQQGTARSSNGWHGQLLVQDHHDHPEDSGHANAPDAGFYRELDIRRAEEEMSTLICNNRSFAEVLLAGVARGIFFNMIRGFYEVAKYCAAKKNNVLLK